MTPNPDPAAVPGTRNPGRARPATVARTFGLALAVAMSLGPARAACPGQNGPIIYEIRGSDPANPSVRRDAILWIGQPEAGGMPLSKDLFKQGLSFPCLAPGSELLAASDPGPEGGGRRHYETSLYDLRRKALMLRTRSFLAPGVPFDAACPVWSPEGDQLAYICCSRGDRSAARELRLLDLTGTRTLLHDLNLYPVAWSKDGRRIAFTRHGQIWVLDLATGKPAAAMTQPGPGGIWPRRHGAIWSPDGKHLAYTQQDSANSLTRVWLSDPDGKDAQCLTDGSNCLLFDWSPDGKKLLYSSRANGKDDLWIQYPTADFRAAQARCITNTPAGSRINAASWGSDIASGSRSSPVFASPGATSSGNASPSSSSSPSSSPNSSASSSSSGMAMPSPRSSLGPGSSPPGGMDVVRAPASAAQSPTPARPMDPVSAASASAARPAPIGQGTVFFWRRRYAPSASPTGPSPLEACDLFQAIPGMPAKPGVIRSPAPRAGGGAAPWCLMPSLSADGRKLAYACLEPDALGIERLAIHVAGVNSGTISPDPTPPPSGTPLNSLWPAFAPDGHRLAFLAVPGRGRALVEESAYPMAAFALYLADAHGPRLLASEVDPTPPAWSAEGDRLLYCKLGEIMEFNLASGHSRTLWKLSGHRFTDLACSPDGNRLALVCIVHGRSLVQVVDMRDWTHQNVTRAEQGFLRRPVWSPDGRQLLFARKVLGRWSLRVRNVRGPGNEHTLAELANQGNTDDLLGAWLPVFPAAAGSAPAPAGQGILPPPGLPRAATPPSSADREPPAKKPKPDAP